MHCPRCAGTALIKRGRKRGYQRFMCRSCGRYCTDRQPKFSAQTKALAVRMYVNSMGIRAIGRVLEASPAAVLTWIRKEHAALQQRLAQADPAAPAPADIIEMDEIYTYVQKNSTAS
jgi:transposase-like protein